MLQVVRDRPRNPDGRIPVRTGWYRIDSQHVSAKQLPNLKSGA